MEWSTQLSVSFGPYENSFGNLYDEASCGAIDANLGDVLDFSVVDDTPTLTKNENATGEKGKISVNVASGIAEKSYSIALGMNGSPVACSPVRAGVHQVWSASPSYAVGIGDFEKGTVVDLGSCNKLIHLHFGDGYDEANVTWKADGSWDNTKYSRSCGKSDSQTQSDNSNSNSN